MDEKLKQMDAKRAKRDLKTGVDDKLELRVR